MDFGCAVFVCRFSQLICFYVPVCIWFGVYVYSAISGQAQS